MLNCYYGSNQNVPCLIALLWGTTDPGFKIIARPQDRPHIYKYIYNTEFNKYITRENEKRKQIRYDFVKIGNKYNIPLDIVKSFCSQYLHNI
jgi:hypothetical protein